MEESARGVLLVVTGLIMQSSWEMFPIQVTAKKPWSIRPQGQCSSSPTQHEHPKEKAPTICLIVLLSLMRRNMIYSCCLHAVN